MAENKIQKAKILNDDLPVINTQIEGYAVRYRLVSEDKNRVSHWSPIHTIIPNYTFEVGSIDILKQEIDVGITWDPVKFKINDNILRTATGYDIWIRWDRGDSGDWVYFSRVEGTNVRVFQPLTYSINEVVQSLPPTTITVEVYNKGNPITREATFLKAYTLTKITD